MSPFVDVLLSIAMVLVIVTSVLAMTAPHILSKQPARLKSLRLYFLSFGVLGVLVLLGLWAPVPRIFAVAAIGCLVAYACFLPRQRLPWRLSVGVAVSALFLGGACWFGVLELLARVGIAFSTLPTFVTIPAALVLGALLGHRLAEIGAELRARASGP